MAAPTVQLNARVPPQLAQLVKRRAKADTTTSNAVVVAALTAYLKGAE